MGVSGRRLSELYCLLLHFVVQPIGIDDVQDEICALELE